MLVEGLVGEELYRIMVDEYRREVSLAKRARLAAGTRSTVSRRGVRRRIGDAIIRTGARFSNVDIDPCLDTSPGSRSAHA